MQGAYPRVDYLKGVSIGQAPATSISNQSFAKAGSSNITRLLPLMPMAFQEFVLWIGKGDGQDKRRKGKESLVYWVGIIKELKQK